MLHATLLLKTYVSHEYFSTQNDPSKPPLLRGGALRGLSLSLTYIFFVNERPSVHPSVNDPCIISERRSEVGCWANNNIQEEPVWMLKQLYRIKGWKIFTPTLHLSEKVSVMCWQRVNASEMGCFPCSWFALYLYIIKYNKKIWEKICKTVFYRWPWQQHTLKHMFIHLGIAAMPKHEQNPKDTHSLSLLCLFN